MLDLMNRYTHGFVVTPVALACKSKGFFETLQQQGPLSLEDLAQRLQANSGHLHVALRAMHSLQWLTKNTDGQYGLTPAAEIHRQIPEDILALYQRSMAVDLTSDAPENPLLHWLQQSRQQWHLESSPLMRDFLDGVLLIPILLALKIESLLPQDQNSPLFSRLSPPVAAALTELLLSKAWLKQENDRPTLTGLGQFMFDRTLITGTTASYRPMLARMDEVLFGDCRAVFSRDAAGHEQHLDRTLNVISSGFQHGKFFADVDEIILTIFNRQPFEQQPKYIADMGCGDGSFLKRIYQLIQSESVRGQILAEYPLFMLGIDFNQKALDATAQNLGDIPHVVMRGDIGDPAQLLIDFQVQGINPDDVLHIRSFLDHDRPFIPPQDNTGVQNRAMLPYQGVYVDGAGQSIPAPVMVQSLVEHLQRWARVAANHGLILLEVHSLPPEIVTQFLDRSENLHFDAYHAFSGQHLVEADVFLMAAAEAGLFPKPGFAKRYPQTFPFCRIALNWFEQKPYTIRHARLDDINALLELEAACWAEPLRTPAAQIRRRIEQLPNGHCVVEMDGRLVAVIYSHLIAAAAVLEDITHSQIPALHDPHGQIIQLLAVNVLPNIPYFGLGDELVEFMLTLAARKNGIERVVGITHSTSYAADSALSKEEHIRRRNERGLLVDPILRFHEAHGATIKQLLPGFRPPEDDHLGLWVLIDYDIYNRQPAALQQTTAPPPVPIEGISDNASGSNIDLLPVIEQAIRAVMGQQRQFTFEPSQPLMEMGLDSLELLEFSDRLSRDLAVNLDPSFFFQYSSPIAIATYFQGQVSADNPQLQSILAGTGRRKAAAKTTPPTTPALSTEAIAIIGLACRFPGAATPEAFWNMLLSGVDAVTVPSPQRRALMQTTQNWPGGFLEQVDQFDAGFFKIPPREAKFLDPQQRLLLELHWEALERAGLNPQDLAGSDTGVFAGLFSHDYELLQAQQHNGRTAYFSSGNSASMAAGRISYFFNFQGPSLAIDTACSSALVALHQAVKSLQHGECSIALASGVNLVLAPDLSQSFSEAGMLAPDGRCKTFGSNANGFGRSEGGAVVVLKRLSEALNDNDLILAVVRGSAVNQNGTSNGLSAPNGLSQEAVMRQALAAGEVAPHQISYVETHGTGTTLGDAVEVKALEAIYKTGRSADNPLWLGTVKTNIGHTEAASGLAGLVKTVLAMRHRTIPPHLHVQEINPLITLEQIPAAIPLQAQPWGSAEERLWAGVSAFGYGGTNAHIILESPRVPVTASGSIERTQQLYTLQARDEASLQALAYRHAEFIAQQPFTASLADMCFTVNTGRANFKHRLSIVTQSHAELSQQLHAFAAGQTSANVIYGQPGAQPPTIAFLFTGQGAQYINMARDLYATQPTFRETINSINEQLTMNNEQVSLLDILYRDENHPIVNQTAYTQPALFAIEYALAKLWQAWGIDPAFVMGHSVGEYVAACLAGVFSLADGLKLISARGRLMQALPQNGQMVAVFAPLEQVMEYLQPDADVTIAAINGPENVVISGLAESVARLVEQLKADGLKSTTLAVSHAFHSPLMKPMLADFAAVLHEVTLRPPRLNLIANVTGTLATDYIATPDYWLSHILQPVRFAASMETLQAYGVDTFIECGPQPTLLSMGRKCLAADHLAWLPSCQRGRSDWAVLLQSLGQLLVRGAAIHWAGFEQDYAPRQRISLPTYPFQRQHYWFDDPALEPDSTIPIMAETGWQQQPLYADLPPTYLPDPAQLVESLTPQLDALLHTSSIKTYEPFLAQFETLTLGYILLAFEQLGWQPEVGQQFSTQQLAEQLGVMAQHGRVLGRYLQILAEEGILEVAQPRNSDDAPQTLAASPPRPASFTPHNATWQVRQPLQPPDPQAQLQRLYALFHQYPQAESELSLFLRCAPKVADVLRGKTNALQRIFPNGDLTTSVKLFRVSAAFGMMNVMAQQTMIAALRNLPAGHTLRILEIGGGTGGTTFGVLPHLSPEQTDYVFTDISRLFTQKAEEEFKQYPFVSYHVLDIEKEPAEQGYTPHAFDLILASNVLHATPSLRQTLTHVKQLLAPGGALLLLEGSAPRRWTDVIFGLIEGWWKFTDFEWRPDYAFLPGERWTSILKEVGFAQAASLSPNPQQFTNVFPQSVIVATTPPAEINILPQRWLILADVEAGLAQPLAALLKTQGHSCSLVYQKTAVQGAHQALVVQPDQPEEAGQIIRVAHPQPFHHLVNLWPLDGATAATPMPFVEMLLTLAPEATLLLVSRGQSLETALYSGLHQLKQSISTAHPDRAITWVDLDPAPQPGDAWTLVDEALLGQPQPGAAGEDVSIRKGLRYLTTTTPTLTTNTAAIRQQLAVAPLGKRRALLQHYLQAEIAQVLEFAATETVSLNRGFFDLGFTSLTSVELATRLQKSLGYTLPLTLAFDYPNINALVDYLLQAEDGPTNSPETPSAIPASNIQSQNPDQLNQHDNDNKKGVESLASSPPRLLASPELLDRIARLEAELNNLKQSQTEAIAVVGIGCRFPGKVNSPQDFWHLLRTGQEAIREVPSDRWDINAYYDATPGTPGKMYTRHGGFVEGWQAFDPYFFGIAPREAISIDPQHRLLLEVSWEGLEHGGIAPAQLINSKTGVFVGIAANDYGHYLLQQQNNQIDAYTAAGHFHSMASGRLSYTLGLQGPSISVDTACSSSLVSVHLACQSLRSRECDLALAGGVNHILAPKISINYAQARMLAADGRCKTFDAAADGFVRAEGAGVVVLKRLSDALANGDTILAVIKGSAVNQDGPSSGLTVPNGPAQQAVIRQALANAQVLPQEVSYVEAHGTGTALGDPIELGALGAVYGQKRSQPLLVGSVKTNVGHLEAAAGIAGLIKVILSLHHNQIPPHLNFNTPNPGVDWATLPLTIPTKETSWPNKNRLAGVSSFGFSGTNAHIILEQAPQQLSRSNEQLSKVRSLGHHLFTLSAKTEEALQQLVVRYRAQLAAQPDIALADVCYTANTGRSHFEHRLAILANSTDQLRQKLSEYNGQSSDDIWRGKINPAHKPKVAFVFSSQKPEAVVQPDKSIPNQIALARLWQRWGIEPEVVLGNGLGEIAAACVAGVFTLEEALQLAASWQSGADIESTTRTITYHPSQIDLVSGLTGQLITDKVSDPAYWNHQLRQPVYASEDIQNRHLLDVGVFIEINPADLRFTMDDLRLIDERGLSKTVLQRLDSEHWRQLLTRLAECYVTGITPNWLAVEDGGGCKIALPTYPFQRQRYWLNETTTPEAVWPSPRQLQQHTAPLLQALSAQPKLPDYQAAFIDLETVSVYFILAALQTLGLDISPGQQWTQDNLAVGLGVVEQQQRLFGRLLKILTEANIVANTGNAWHVLPTTQPRFTSAETEALTRQHAAVAGAEFSLLARCGAQLAQVLQGSINPLTLLFPDNDGTAGDRLDTVTRLYQNALPFTAINRLTKQVLAAICQHRPAGQMVQILEIGAGTGATSAYLLPHCPASQTHYVFSDISPLFTGRAQETFKDYGFVSYQTLNIEQDPLNQGLTPGQFNIAVASNVLHATQNLSQTLAHVQQLLAPGGLLILLEVTAPQRWLDLVFGLLDGWWRFTDFTLRPDYPLLDVKAWQTLLTTSGFETVAPILFSGIDIEDSNGPGRVVSQQTLLVAQMPSSSLQIQTTIPPQGKGLQLADRLASILPLSAPQISLQEQLTQVPMDERLALLQNYIKTEVARVLGWNSPDLIDMQQGFFNLGMDSLTSMELKNRLQNQLEITLPPTLTFDHPTAEALVNYLAQELFAPLFTQEPDPTPETAATVSDNGHDPENVSGDLTDTFLMSDVARQLAKKLGLKGD